MEHRNRWFHEEAQAEQGSSLLEVLVAMQILAVLLMVLIPWVKEPYEDWLLKRFLAELEEDLQTLPLIALSERGFFDIAFLEERYFIYSWKDGVIRSVTYPKLIRFVRLDSYPGNNIIRFSQRGTASRGGTICIATKKGIHHSFVFTLDTGKARYKKGCV
ncbi:prepilin-type N-terminal cleavage/methylation domain-containing protein [Rubeoparvulum massiliense]|uniref:prepilin-type N-terminal cleavage/methylation domain-containing protein n=1 Tax=Rubeoparvulum massiliense TaxID=1631346 RepID=UPI0011C6F92B|nr:prepilin-type N-terminal cleavage/methylation domain-containing protein [Rubeoparvulum massiliense]